MTGQFRPVDIPDSLTFARSLKAAHGTGCAGGTTTEVTSFQFLLEDKTFRSLTVVSSARCAPLSDGSTDIVVPIANLSGPWANVIDPALPFAATPGGLERRPAYTTQTAEASPRTGSQTRTSTR